MTSLVSWLSVLVDTEYSMVTGWPELVCVILFLRVHTFCPFVDNVYDTDIISSYKVMKSMSYVRTHCG